MNEYVEVEEPRELKRFARALFATIKVKLTNSETRNIGAPNGTFLRKVYSSAVRAPVPCIERRSVRRQDRCGEFFLSSRTGVFDRSLYLASVQRTGCDVLAEIRRRLSAPPPHKPNRTRHRGIVTLGHNRVRQSMVFRDMEAWSAEAETSQGARTFLLIGELNSPGLIEDISRFAKDLRGQRASPDSWRVVA